MIAVVTLACFCGIASALGFSWLIQYFRGRYEQAEGTASVIFGSWITLSLLIVFLDRVAAFREYSDLVVVVLLGAAALSAGMWIARVLHRPVRR